MSRLPRLNLPNIPQHIIKLTITMAAQTKPLTKNKMADLGKSMGSEHFDFIRLNKITRLLPAIPIMP